MKKLESTWYNMVVVLTVISVIAGAALAYVNALTEGPIADIQKKNEADAIKAVLGGKDVEITETDTIGEGDAQAIVYITAEGAAVKTGDPNNASFGGGLSVMVGLSKDYQVLGYSILETHETPGLGAKAAEWFNTGGKGCIIGKTAGKLTVSKDGGEVDAITASTITSRAFLRAVNNAVAAYSEAQGEKTDVASGASVQEKKAEESGESATPGETGESVPNN